MWLWGGYACPLHTTVCVSGSGESMKRVFGFCQSTRKILLKNPWHAVFAFYRSHLNHLRNHDLQDFNIHLHAYLLHPLWSVYNYVLLHSMGGGGGGGWTLSIIWSPANNHREDGTIIIKRTADQEESRRLINWTLSLLALPRHIYLICVRLIELIPVLCNIYYYDR